MQQEMKYVYQVYQERSFSKAAQKLYISQPALSIAIQRVESEVGMPLFDRSYQPLELTDAGKIYIKKVEEIQALENELAAQIDDLSGLKSGTIRIGGTHYFNSYVLPSVLALYSSTFPGIHIDLIEAHSGELVKMLLNNKIDLTFNCNPLDDNKFRRHPVFNDTILLAVPSAFPVNNLLRDFALTNIDVLAKKYIKPECPYVDMEYFSTTPFILLTAGNNLHERSMSFFDSAGIKPPIKLEVQQLVTAYHLACQGLGATFVSAMLVKAHSNTDVLYYKIDSPLATRIFDIILRKNSYISNPINEFLHTFLEIY